VLADEAPVEDPQCHRVTFYDWLAEISGEYVKKGRLPGGERREGKDTLYSPYQRSAESLPNWTASSFMKKPPTTERAWLARRRPVSAK
jgi:hypothetical protein